MRSSAILTLLGATLAVAAPAHQALHAHHAKKAYAYDIVTDIVYVTVTEGELPSTSQPGTTVVVQHTVYVNPVESSTPVPTTTSSIYVPPPPPSTTSEPPPPTTTSTTEAPAPTTTTEAPPTTTTEAASAETQQAATVDTTSSDTSSDPMASAAVSNHNSCRSSHSAPSVTYNDTLASYAAKTAATCVFAHDMTEGGGGYGQNIAAQGSSSSDAWTSESAVENAIISEWYSEESLYSGLYGQASPSTSGSDFLHFTQIVWVASTQIGCAVQACPQSNSIFPGDYTWFTVCNYFPAGNVIGEFNTNVLES